MKPNSTGTDNPKKHDPEAFADRVIRKIKADTAARKEKADATQLQVTPEIHEAVRLWYDERRQYLKVSEVARLVNFDASTFRKVLSQETFGKGTTYTFPDEVVRKLYQITAEVGTPCNLPKTRKRRT